MLLGSRDASDLPFRMPPPIPVTPQALVEPLEYAGPVRVVTNATGLHVALGTFSTWVIDAPNAKCVHALCRYVFLGILCVRKICSRCSSHVRAPFSRWKSGPRILAVA